MPSSPHHIIVGSGVFGASTALALVRAGHRVTVLDRSEDGFVAPDGASHDLNKIIRSDYSDPYYRRLAKRAISIWRQSPLLSRFYHEVGFLLLSGPSNPQARSYAEEGVTRARIPSEEPPSESKLGLPYARLVESPEDALRCFPSSVFSEGNRPGEDITGLDGKEQSGYFNPRAGWGEANASTRAVLAEAQRLGANIVGKAEVTGVLRSDEKSEDIVGVTCADGREFRVSDGGNVVLCPGSWATGLLERLFSSSSTAPHQNSAELIELLKNMPMQASAEAVMTLQLDEEQRRRFKGAPVIINYQSGFYVFEPNEAGIVKVAFHNAGYATPRPPTGVTGCAITYPSFPDPFNPTASLSSAHPNGRETPPEGLGKLLLGELSKVYPELADRAKVLGTRFCWYSDTSDENWIIDAVPGTKNLYLAAGCCGHAYKFLPLLGDLLCARMTIPTFASLSPHEEKVFSFRHHVGLAKRGKTPEVVAGEGTGGSRILQGNERARL